MQLRSRVIVIESQPTQSQPTQTSKRTRIPSQKAIESKESKKALAIMDAQNLRQKLQQLETQTPISNPQRIQTQTPKSRSIGKTRIRTLSLKAIEAQENQTFMEALDAEEEEIQSQKQQQKQPQNRYQTRSNNNNNKTPYSIAEFTQDFFNDASESWRANKIKKPNATYQYRCSERLKNKNRCCSKTLHSQFYCKSHTK